MNHDQATAELAAVRADIDRIESKLMGGDTTEDWKAQLSAAATRLDIARATLEQHPSST